MDHDIDCSFLYTHGAKEEGITMTTKSQKKGAPEPSKIRTNRDWVMIALGVFLTLLLLTLGYWSIGGPDSNPVPNKRGPVKDPKSTGMLPGRENFPEIYPQITQIEKADVSIHSCGGLVEGWRNEKTPSDGLTGKSMPLPDGVLSESQYTISRCGHQRRFRVSVFLQDDPFLSTN